MIDWLLATLVCSLALPIKAIASIRFLLTTWRRSSRRASSSDLDVVLNLPDVLTASAESARPRSVDDKKRGDDEDEDRPTGLARGGSKEPAPASSPRAEAEISTPEFLFTLRGPKAQGAFVEAGSVFDLLFEYRVPSLKDHTRVRGDNLRQAVATDGDVEVAIVPGRLTIPDGRYLQVAQFRQGGLSNDVRFTLRAEDETGDAGVHVFLGVNGCILYDFPLPIRVVRSLDSAVKTELHHETRTVDLDEFARAKIVRAQRDVRLVFNKVGGDIHVLFHEIGKPELQLALRRIDAGVWSNLLTQTAADAKEVVDKSFWNSFAAPLEPAADEEVRSHVRAARNRLISAGASLHRALVADQNLAYVFDHIEGLEPGSRLSVLSDCGFLPLEILYPRDYHHSDEAPPTASLLWGYRFRIEHLTWDGGVSHSSPIEAEQHAAPFVSLNLDPSIDRQLSEDVSRQPPFLPVAAHHGLLNTKRGWTTETNQEFTRIAATLKTDHAATLLYYYCHGQSGAPFSSDPVAKLAFGTEFIDPDWVRAQPPFRHAPIIVLNSCASGDAGPLSFLTFLERFRQKGAAGIVSTWFAIPMLFASAFGRELITRYADAEPLGDALYHLRRRLLDHDNPLGFFYALQCPMDLKAPAAILKQEAA